MASPFPADRLEITKKIMRYLVERTSKTIKLDNKPIDESDPNSKRRWALYTCHEPIVEGKDTDISVYIYMRNYLIDEMPLKEFQVEPARKALLKIVDGVKGEHLKWNDGVYEYRGKGVGATIMWGDRASFLRERKDILFDVKITVKFKTADSGTQ